jgi:hypothetical protein
MLEDVGDILNKLESAVTDSKKAVDLADSLGRLEQNPDFIKIISDGYFKQLAIKLVEFKGSPECINALEIDTDRSMISIGKLQAYLTSIKNNGEIAKHTIDQCNEEIININKNM